MVGFKGEKVLEFHNCNRQLTTLYMFMLDFFNFITYGNVPL